MFNMLDQMRSSFLNCMIRLYPLGGLEIESQQRLKELIMVFFAGYIEALRPTERVEAIAEYKIIVSLAWMPDTTWIWPPKPINH